MYPSLPASPYFKTLNPRLFYHSLNQTKLYPSNQYPTINVGTERDYSLLPTDIQQMLTKD